MRSGSIFTFFASPCCLGSAACFGAGSITLKLSVPDWDAGPLSWLLSELTSELTIDGTRFSLSDLLETTYAAANEVASTETVASLSSLGMAPQRAWYKAWILADTCGSARRAATDSER
ncbi:hypothetical protein OGATHE_005615 [Ogataea polymorpha]|uniref:Uncharacterized protein n=1 Tax=Ogataea polymorpha TaxID=460523 RepID=A0A9P8SZ80_9ASCO|nr:hypothetical protein OGATHE_005615 [Ogataea polymorpha]